MRLLILTASLWALVLAKPEMYKESEDFQYSRSSSDEGSKSGFYGAQRGNMGGNYEKAHNMDSMAQHHMSTLVRQIDGELGEGANTKTGSVFTAGNSRGIYGSGNYDLSNLKGRNFGENGGYDSQSSLYQNTRYQGNSYANNARYGEQSLSSNQRSGYSSSNLESEYSKNKLESENSNYDYGALGGSNMRYYSIANSQAGSAYDKSSTNQHSTYDLSNRLSSTTPVKIYIRPGERVALPISAPTYTLYSSNLHDKNVADTTNVLSNSGSEVSYKPINNAKHYESAYSYHKKWEKHDSQPVVIPTENPFPANSELYEDRELDTTGQRYQSELSSLNSHLNNANNGYSAHQNYQSGIASANAQSSRSNSEYSSGYSANTKTASASQSRYESENQNKAASASSNAYSAGTHNLGASATNLNNLVEDINSKPKSYQSSFSYHKAWERRGDPYVIIPSSEVNGQQSQKLITSQNQGQFSSQQHGSHYNQRSYSNIDCDALCHLRKKRSYNINQYQQGLNNEDIHLGQQTEDGWDLSQQTENKFENLEDLGQATQDTWDNFENLGQQSQNHWNNFQNLGQEIQSKWNNLGQQTQNNWDHLTDLGQQTQSEWSNHDDLGQNTENQKTELENFNQEAQNHVSNVEDLGQKSQGEWNKLEDLGENTQSLWGALGHETQSKWDALGSAALNKMDELGQETQREWDDLGQQSQRHWGKLEDLGQQTQNNWEKQKGFDKRHKELENKTQTADNKNIIINQKEKKITNFGSNEAASHKFLWDTINQMFEEPPKTENTDKNFNRGESLLKVYQNEQLPTDKQPKDDRLQQSNKNEQTFSTTPNYTNQGPFSTDSTMHSKPKDEPDKQKKVNIPTNPFEIWQNQGTDLDQQSESQWSHLGQQSENNWGNMGQQSETQWSNLGQQSDNHWSNLGQQIENHWSSLGQQSENHWSNLGQQSENDWGNLGQQSENHWSNLGQQSENEWGNLGQQSENHWSNLGQQSENHWSNLGQQSENDWGNLGQQSENHWSNLGQQSENEWSNLGQQSENHWSSLGQQSENKWDNLGTQDENQKQWGELSQQTQNVWNNLDQQSQFTGGQQTYFNQDKRDNTKTEITHEEEDQRLKEYLEDLKKVSWSHHSQTNNDNQPKPEDTENFHGNNKELINCENIHSEKQNVEHISHDVASTSSKLPNKPISVLSTTTSRTSTEVQGLPGVNTDTANIGRGDIGAEDDNIEFDGYIIDVPEKKNLIVFNLPSTTMKPIRNEHREPYDHSHSLINPTTQEIPVIEKLTPERPKPTTLLSQNVLEQTTDEQQQFEQQNIETQQTQEDLSVLPAHLDSKTVTSPSPNPSIQSGRSLESAPIEAVLNSILKQELAARKNKGSAEQEIKQEVINIESAPIKHIEIETPLEPTTEKPGFWSSVWNKTKNAKNTVASWFKN